MSENAKTARVKLNDGLSIPQVGLGVWQAGGGTKPAVLAALNAGYRHVDTAAVYGNEAQVGAAVAESGVPREQIFVTSKLWNHDHGYDKVIVVVAGSIRPSSRFVTSWNSQPLPSGSRNEANDR